MDVSMETELFDLKGKVAVVTGGAGVLGGSIARSLVTAGVKVVILDIRKELVDQRVKDLREAGAECFGIVGSVLDIDELEIAAVSVENEYGMKFSISCLSARV